MVDVAEEVADVVADDEAVDVALPGVGDEVGLRHLRKGMVSGGGSL